jgi:hypothetical protein
MSDKRVKTSVSLPGADFEPFRRWCEAGGRIQGDMLGRVLRWFVKQDPLVWRAIVDGVEAELRGAWATVLRRMADEIEQGNVAGPDPLAGQGITIDPHGRARSERERPANKRRNHLNSV